MSRVGFSPQHYQAVIDTPFARVGLAASGEALTRIDFVPADMALLAPATPLLRETARQLHAYSQDADFRFDLPYQLNGSEHQCKVWLRIAQIPPGKVIRYADIAHDIGSVPRAIGGACGANPLPVLIPCHRVVSAQGLGGFNANRNGMDWMPVKRWLLRHEGVLRDWFD
ncbi:methylated-DNA--[protein]-cysteine S-methyltransferase [Andreprevotia sp. IGB-42]|uniref:methylated-DNA--[protein]-cysteine S-methyltransferase n=1 Tax=Andreprevotia sp. IGB-42 TaxID=2497473 RepID=UPI00191DBAED|nr:methylated-DNA--[protein]-cysteine S-methyltransferase [Andreprevotia sp. IGB-42]